MSALEETIAKPIAADPMAGRNKESILTRVLKLFCSVRFGVTLLVLLGLACLIGMLVMQQNVDGFDRYFADLTPAQRLVYGKLGIFDIYHSWYFNALLALLSANIVLTSVDRFPKAWKFLSKPNVTVPVRWLRDQKQTAEIALEGSQDFVIERIRATMKEFGWKKFRLGEKNGKVFVLGESGAWNRLGAYAVHVGLLTIFLGGFLTGQFGSTGNMPLTPGESTNLTHDTLVELDKANEITKRLPFEVTCTDIQQKLIKKEGSIDASNTIDWITRFRIKDETGEHDASVQMNRPFDYRGYRFFQASFVPVGRARNITLDIVPAEGGETQTVNIPRDGSATLADGTRINFSEFRAVFSIRPEDPNEDTSNYENPAAVLQVFRPGSAPQTAYAFGPQMANIPVAKKPVLGYLFRLADFEKVSAQHVLSVQRDPGATVVYVGFVLLVLTLIAVFFFSHQRVWAAIESTPDNKHNIVLGGNTNRNSNAFGEKFDKFARKLKEVVTTT